MKWTEIDRKLREKGILVFTGKDLMRLAGLTPASAKFLLIRYIKRGLLRRLRRGLYAAAERLPPDFVIANRLYRPSYVSLESALAFHHVIPESVYAVTSVTAKPTRRFDVLERAYIYRTIKLGAFAGYEAKTLNGQTVWVARPEKALADYLYFVFLKKSPRLDRVNFGKINRRILAGDVRSFGNPG
ncbi:MAG: type IV toxin-antitoxin system AbiEi family antitoxin domain-containing protein, partial [Elusimicrobia bacterium]|nr:type IV toxin-antitoxin system AbiEi family antitoxin domain-containing protein [Elusimicrobiota bacterium]